MKKSFVIIFVLSISTQLFSIPMITFSGEMNSGFWGKNGDGSYIDGDRNVQYESAVNLNLEAEYSDRLAIDLDLGLGNDDSTIGFVEKAELLGAKIEYRLSQSQSFSMGTLTVPVGIHDQYTDNAQSSSNFLMNDLTNIFLSGNNVRSLIANGMLYSGQFNKYGDIHVMFMNGTDSLNSNTDNGFGVAIHAENSDFFRSLFRGSSLSFLTNKSTIGVSYINSNDYGNENGIDANLTVIRCDGKTSIGQFNIGAYVALLVADDFNDSTSDKVVTYMVYGDTEVFSADISLRITAWQPRDYDANGSGISSALVSPGLGESTTTQTLFVDQDISRVELGVSVPVEDSLRLNGQVIYDVYGDSYFNTLGLFSYATVKF